MNKYLDILAGTAAGISLVSIGRIISLIAATLSIVSALLSIYIKLRAALKDGVIDDHEKEDIISDIDDIKNNLEDLKKDE